MATTAGLIGRTGKPYFARIFSGLTRPKKDILGIEFAGEIAEIGSAVTRFRKGDRVFGMTHPTDPGAYAEFKALPEDGSFIHLPENLNFFEAAAAVEGGLTAINFLMHKAQLRSGQSILINGASGAVGTAAVQVARSIGAEVTGVCSGANHEMVRSLGAQEMIDYTKEDFTHSGKRYDVIFDTVGKRSFAECKGSLKENGLYLDPAGVATILPMMWTALVGGKRAILSASYLRSTAARTADLHTLKGLIEAGQFNAVIDRYYRLDNLAAAHRYVETGHKKGNVVIAVAHDETGEIPDMGKSQIVKSR